MAENTKIEWCDHTVNLWHGCVEVHAGCDNCYAKVLNNRYHKENPHWGNNVPRLEVKSAFKDLEKFQKLAEAEGKIHRVFVGSMMDIFEKPMPLVNGKGELYKNINTDVKRQELFANIGLGLYPNLIFLFLTKRPSNINKYIPEAWKTNPPSNVMFGTSVVNKETAEKLVYQLLEVNGKRFLSCEPLLGPVNLYPLLNLTNEARSNKPGSAIDWIICGGESGHGARPMHPDWARSLRDQCKAAGVPFFFKQWGEYLPHCQVDNLEQIVGVKYATLFQSPNNPNKKNTYYKVGKKAAGKLLDGVEHNEFPSI